MLECTQSANRNIIYHEAGIVGKIDKSRMVRMKAERLLKTSEAKRKGGCRKRGRQQLRWDDCVKIDLRKAAEGGRKME